MLWYYHVYFTQNKAVREKAKSETFHTELQTLDNLIFGNTPLEKIIEINFVLFKGCQYFWPFCLPKSNSHTKTCKVCYSTSLYLGSVWVQRDNLLLVHLWTNSFKTPITFNQIWDLEGYNCVKKHCQHQSQIPRDSVYTLYTYSNMFYSWVLWAP